MPETSIMLYVEYIPVKKKKARLRVPASRKITPRKGFGGLLAVGWGELGPPPQGYPKAVPAAWLVWASLLLDPICHLLAPGVRQDDTTLAPGSLSPRTGLRSPPH